MGLRVTLMATVWAALLSAAFVPARNLVGQELLDEVRAGNKAALESIRSFSCRVTMSSVVGSGGPASGSSAEYWWSNGASRVRSNENGQLRDSVARDFTFHVLTKGRDVKGRQQTTFLTQPITGDEPHGPFDPWSLGLFKLCGPKGWPLTLDEILSRPHILNGVERRSEGGRNSIVVDLSMELLPGNHGDFEIWFDPAVNYLAFKVVGSPSSSGTKEIARQSEVTRFIEVEPAIYFPQRAERKFFKDGRCTYQAVVDFSDIRVNQAIAESMFEIPIPPGAHVVDAVNGSSYRTDATGTPGPPSALSRFPSLPAAMAVANETREEPQPATRWILPISIAIIALAAALWFIRRRFESASAGQAA